MNAGPKPDLMIAAASPLPVHLDSRELFRSGNEVVIVHKGEEYRLRITRNEKLILTK
ncbi:MAG: hemin uptake protein HemP [Burkholderiales bacterium]|nr:hemin uptake protein HemP [Burkholderiales bacterium]